MYTTNPLDNKKVVKCTLLELVHKKEHEKTERNTVPCSSTGDWCRPQVGTIFYHSIQPREQFQSEGIYYAL